MIRSIKRNHQQDQAELGVKDFNTFKQATVQAGANASFLRPLIDGCEGCHDRFPLAST